MVESIQNQISKDGFEQTSRRVSPTLNTNLKKGRLTSEIWKYTKQNPQGKLFLASTDALKMMKIPTRDLTDVTLVSEDQSVTNIFEYSNIRIY